MGISSVPAEKQEQAKQMVGMLKQARDNMADDDNFDRWQSILSSDTGRDQLMREGNKIMSKPKAFFSAIFKNAFEDKLIEIFGELLPKT